VRGYLGGGIQGGVLVVWTCVMDMCRHVGHQMWSAVRPHGAAAKVRGVRVCGWEGAAWGRRRVQGRLSGQERYRVGWQERLKVTA
jgi:hypothetical protein